MPNLTRVTLRLTAYAVEQLELESKKRGLPRNRVIQEAIDRGLAPPEANAANLNRIAQTLEFLQIAIDHVHKRDLEPVRDVIMLNVAKRMEQHHGAR